MIRIFSIMTGSGQGRPATLDPIRVVQRRLEIDPEHFEIYCLRKGLEPVAEIAQPLHPVVKVERHRLPRHPDLVTCDELPTY